MRLHAVFASGASRNLPESGSWTKCRLWAAGAVIMRTSQMEKLPVTMVTRIPAGLCIGRR